ncbi:MAG: type II toxin-antitoxin system PemK/MazF family toxin [Alphaproteobacteria bacterium]|nr:type II toxin-antitoxin system PemK/MazF family toxin [Alphaproteobacteria bacterium]
MNRGDLVTVALQGEHGKPRPALVIQSDLFANLTSTVTIALLTSAELDIPIFRVPIEPSETNGLRTRSFVMIDQTFSANTRRFGDVFGRLEDADLLSVNRALAVFLGIAS